MNKVQGRPPIAPRVEALEKRVTDLENAVRKLAAIHKPEPGPVETYEPQFTQWPGNSGST